MSMTRAELFELNSVRRMSERDRANFIKDLEELEALPKIEKGDKLHLPKGGWAIVKDIIITAGGNYGVVLEYSCNYVKTERFVRYPLEYEISNKPSIPRESDIKIERMPVATQLNLI